MTKAYHDDSPEHADAQNAKRLLQRFRVDDGTPWASGWIPAWSSDLLEKTISQILATPESSAAGLSRGLWELLGETRAPLTQTMVHFIHDVVVLCFTAHRPQYGKEEQFEWMAEQLTRPCTEAQAFLAAYALPNSLAKSRRAEILAVLKSSSFLSRAESMLEVENSDLG